MKAGGNAKCAAYLQQKGVNVNTSIKQKYESPAAQLYKEVLKARVEGRPEPTELPKAAPRGPSPASGGYTGIAAAKPGEDPNGMERLTGETDQQYIARQTRLRDEAKQRMAAKFGNGGGMGGVGSSRMAGIGSNPSYNPNGGYSSDLGVDSLVAGLGSAWSSIGSVAKGAAASASSLIQDEQIQSIGGSMWSTLSSTVSSVAATLAQPDGGDSLEEFNRQMASKRSMTGSKYSGFGSDNLMNGNSVSNSASGGGFSSAVTIQEAPGAPGEDRNGIERLTGESDEQYVVRQTRLRDEAKARMAAKFGGGGLGSSSSVSSNSSSSMSFAQRPAAPPASGSTPVRPAPPRAAGVQSAPTSGNWGNAAPTPPRVAPAVKMKVESNDDFFASFGA